MAVCIHGVKKANIILNTLQRILTEKTQSNYTGRFGNSTMGLFLKVTKFTTKIMI